MGQSTLPSRSVSFSGRSATSSAPVKNAREKRSRSSSSGASGPAKGGTAISKEVLAVRGMARQGPMAR